MHNTGWEDSHLCGVSQLTASKGYFGDSSGKHILHNQQCVLQVSSGLAPTGTGCAE